MKKLHFPFLKATNWAFAGLLSLLGFPSCDKQGELMYGSPYASFSIHGKIQTEAKAGIPDIEVRMVVVTEDGKGICEEVTRPLRTDEKGEFSTTFAAPLLDRLRVYATDIDRSKNGSFAKDSLDILFESKDFKGKKKDNWDMGQAEKEITIELKETKENE